MDLIVIIAVSCAMLSGILAFEVNWLIVEFRALRQLCQAALLYRAMEKPSSIPYTAEPAQPGDVKFHFPRSMFPEPIDDEHNPQL